MRQTIPFTKDITFKTSIGEITSISLDDDLIFKKEDLISGNFYISGSYKMIDTSTIEETYSYKVPCEIAISDEYDTFYATVDIDDFNYEIIDDDILRINIVVGIDKLQKKEVKKEEIKEEEKEERSEGIIKDDRCIEDETDSKIESFLDVKESVKKQEDTYLTYKVYMFKEGDTIDSVLDKYSITREELSDYNDLDNIKPGMKLVIPSTNVKL